MSEEQSHGKPNAPSYQSKNKSESSQTSIGNNLFQPMARPAISDNLLDDPIIAAILQPPSTE